MMHQRAFHHGPPDRHRLLAAIHATATAMGLSKPDRYDLQLELTGITSCSDMDLAQLQQVDRELRRLQRMLPPEGSKRRTGRDERRPAEPPTPEQLELIQNLSKLLGLALEQYRKLCMRILHHSWPQTRAEANQVIEAMKAMQRRGWKPKEAQQ